MRRLVVAVCLAGAAALARGQSPVRINVDLQRSEGAFTPVYAWVGYDESGYTTSENGRALLQQLHDATPAPLYVRAHFLLASGDGKPELKWSSSNVYAEDANGNPVYDWRILDSIFDAWVGAGVSARMWSWGSCRRRCRAIPIRTTFHGRPSRARRRAGRIRRPVTKNGVR